MATASLFIGMVTHARSRFNVDDAAARTVAELERATALHGLAVRSLVSARDDYDPDRMPVGRRLGLRSAFHQAELERRWRRYLAAGGAAGARHAVADAAAAGAMAAARVGRYLGSGGNAALVRLVNIDLSHLRVMAAAGDADWALIVEDDAGVADATETADRLVELIGRLRGTRTAFVNLSESLSTSELGVDGLFRVSDRLSDGTEVLGAERPVTNTVCATLYRGDYLKRLRTGIVERGLTPVAPIDWRVNEVIMAMHAAGELGSRSCVWVRPGLFLQRSMHDG